MIFVFGSNEGGRHGKGAALSAILDHGAIYGRGYGIQGDAFAIPTKDRNLRPLSLAAVEQYVRGFLDYARKHPEMEFQVTQIGCGLAGFTAAEIAPLFSGAPDNCLFDSAWSKLLPGRSTWGNKNAPPRKE